MREDILELLANPPAAAEQAPAEQPAQEPVAPAKAAAPANAIDEELLEELVNPLEQLNDVMKHMGHKKRQPGKFHRGL